MWGSSAGIAVPLPLVALVACGGPVQVNLPQPLFVVDTFPASGATVERAHVDTLSVTFSEDLGDDVSTSGRVADKARLVRRPPEVDGNSAGEPVALGSPGYDPASFTVVFTPDPADLDRVSTPGSQLVLTLGAGLAARSGPALAADVRVHFWIAAAADAQDEELP